MGISYNSEVSFLKHLKAIPLKCNQQGKYKRRKEKKRKKKKERKQELSVQVSEDRAKSAFLQLQKSRQLAL